ncbi:recombinase family protein [Pyruvatibacter mobilis]|uniref:recombinase family protein n=1 Tax=Pyruvatibacter mobilis TaxID=1712261 RepID=UPI003C7CC393
MTTGKPANSETGKRIGYARNSTDKQTLYQYTDALKAAGCELIFVDEATSAVAKKRPGLAKARDALMQGDTFVVVAIDRAFRSTIEGITFLDELHSHGIAFESIYQQIDTRTPEGRKWFIDMVNNAEYERAVISRRTKEKMAAAKRRGVHCGRRFALTSACTRQAHTLVTKHGLSLTEAAQRKHVTPLTLRRSFKREGLEV